MLLNRQNSPDTTKPLAKFAPAPSQDIAWDQDDHLSMASGISEGSKSKKQKIRRPLEVYYPIVALGSYFAVEMLPLMVNCVSNPSSACLDWDSIVKYPVLKVLQDTGNVLIFTMTMLTIYSLFKTQTQRFNNINNENMALQSVLNFSFGIVTAFLYISWIILESRPNLQQELGVSKLAFYNGFLFFLTVYNFVNIMLLKNSISDRNFETFVSSNTYRLKVVVFIMTALLTITFFVFEAMNAQTGQYMNYVAFFGTAAVFLQMINFASYTFDIDFISKMLTLKEDSQYFVDKKLKLNNL